jgi:HEAT repeat protein
MSQPGGTSHRDEDSLTRRKLVDLASDAPRIYEAARAWFLAQGPPIVTVLLQGLDEEGLGSVCHWRILLLLRHFAQESTLPAILRTLRRAADRRDPMVLPGAMEAAAVFRNPEASQALMQLLQDRDPDTVKHAAVLVGGMGDREAIGRLALLLRSDSSSIRYSAIKGLISAGGPEVQDVLRNHLGGETDPEARALIVAAGVGGSSGDD